jgi:hypothetical protein
MLQAESLGKKYEEKYKQVAEIASKLTVEEAKFRDIQVVRHSIYYLLIDRLFVRVENILYALYLLC